jgi:F0F1-type ATP synthase assembly protein I
LLALCEKFHASGMARPPEEKPRTEGLRTAGLLLSIPALLIAAPLVGLFSGMALDRWLKTGRIFTGIGIVLGFAAAGRETWRIIRRVQEDEEPPKRP